MNLLAMGSSEISPSKTVLCFGDSLTWGQDPATGGRHQYSDRWPQVAGKILGPDYHLIEEGLCGRTTVHDDQYSEHRNGAAALPMLLESHSPLDLVVIFLGANDFQIHRDISPREAAMGIIRLQQIVCLSRFGPNLKAPQCLVVCPPHLGEPEGLMSTLFRETGEKIKELANEMSMIAGSFPLLWMDAAKYVTAEQPDGVHLSAGSSRKLGEVIASRIRDIFEAAN